MKNKVINIALVIVSTITYLICSKHINGMTFNEITNKKFIYASGSFVSFVLFLISIRSLFLPFIIKRTTPMSLAAIENIVDSMLKNDTQR